MQWRMSRTASATAWLMARVTASRTCLLRRSRVWQRRPTGATRDRRAGTRKEEIEGMRLVPFGLPGSLWQGSMVDLQLAQRSHGDLNGMGLALVVPQTRQQTRRSRQGVAQK